MGCGASASRQTFQKKVVSVEEATTEAKEWAAAVECSSAAAVNAKIESDGGPVKTMLLAEAWHDSQIVQAVQAVTAKRESSKNTSALLSLILIAGPSSSGKTTFCAKLSMHLRAAGMKPETLSTDDYFLARVDPRHPKDEQGQLDFESVEAVDVERLNADMKKLFAGETVETPIFNFVKGAPEEKQTRTKKLDKDGILIMEGIFCLNPQLTPHIELSAKFRVFIAPMSPLVLNDDSIVREDHLRLIRRISRDYLHRGSNALHTVKKYDSVRKGELRNIFPFVQDAEFVYNSSLLYELHVLKTKVRPLLEQIKSGEEEVARGVLDLVEELLKMLDSFNEIPTNDVPNTSVLMEFIGNSVFED